MPWLCSLCQSLARLGTDEFNGGGLSCNGLASHSGESRETLVSLKCRITNSVYEIQFFGVSEIDLSLS